MTTTLLVLTLTVFGAADTPSTKEKPKHSPYAPSLPYLTKEEEDHTSGKATSGHKSWSHLYAF
jgi:hypothetical protein